MKKLLLEVVVPNFTFQQPVRLPVYSYPHQHLSSFLTFASLLDVKRYPRVFFSACFLIKYFECLFCQTLCKAVEMLPKEETWLLCFRRAGWTLPAYDWQRCRGRSSMQPTGYCCCSTTVGMILKKSDLGLERWAGIFRQHIKLKDIPGGEEGTRQRHRGVKPIILRIDWVFMTVESPRIGRPRERRSCGRVGRLKELSTACIRRRQWKF